MSNKTHTLFITFIVLLITIYSYGQGFNTYYQSSNSSLANKTEYLDANKFVLTSYYVDSNGDQGLDLKHIDNQGQVLLWKRYMFYGRPFLMFLNNNIQADVSNSTMLLTAGSYIDTASAVIFTSVNKYTLDTNWTRYYADGLYNYYINNAFKVKPNEVWFMGQKGNNYGYNLRPFVFRMDTLGNLLGVKEFTSLVNYDPSRIHYDYSSGLLYFGGVDYSNAQSLEGYVLCMDTAGNVSWNKHLGNNSHGFYEIQKKNNYIILSGFKWIGNNGNFDLYKLELTKMNVLNGNIIWQKSYAYDGVATYLSGFTINNDESIVATGTIEYTIPYVGYTWDGLILKANSNGDSLWMRTYNTYTTSAQEVFLNLEPTPDGGYLLAGGDFYSGNDRSWVVKTDSLGIGPGAITSTVVTAINEVIVARDDLSLYPNPASDKVFIRSTSNQNLYLNIYNNTGQLVREEELVLKDGSVMLKTPDLLSGIYLVKVYDSNKVLVKSSKLIIAK